MGRDRAGVPVNKIICFDLSTIFLTASVFFADKVFSVCDSS